MYVVYFGGAISGGHFNPAVTVAVFLTSNRFHSNRTNVKCQYGWLEIPAYWIAQLCGALLAAEIGNETLNTGYPGVDVKSPKKNPSATDGAAIAVEFLGTMSLVLVVLNVATVSTANAGNSTFGLAIGFTVTAWAIAGGAISGGAFNPAVGSMSLLHSDAADDVWIYWVGPLLGSLMAVVVFYITNPKEFFQKPEEVELTEKEGLSMMLATVKTFVNEFIGTALFCIVISLAAGQGHAFAGIGIGAML